MASFAKAFIDFSIARCSLLNAFVNEDNSAVSSEFDMSEITQ
jgi:hypothetical protein